MLGSHLPPSLARLVATLALGALAAGCDAGASQVADRPDDGGGLAGAGGSGAGGQGAGGHGGGGSGGSGGSGGGGGLGPCGIEIGTGATDAFEPLVAGQEVQVASLGQGGQHIWGGIRVTGFPGDVFLDYDLVGLDGTLIAHNPACVPLLPSPLGDGFRERGGLVGYLPPGGAEPFVGGADVILRMRARSGLDGIDCRPPDEPRCDLTGEVRVHAIYEPVDGGGGGCGVPGCF